MHIDGSLASIIRTNWCRRRRRTAVQKSTCLRRPCGHACTCISKHVCVCLQYIRVVAYKHLPRGTSALSPSAAPALSPASDSPSTDSLYSLSASPTSFFASSVGASAFASSFGAKDEVSGAGHNTGTRLTNVFANVHTENHILLSFARTKSFILGIGMASRLLVLWVTEPFFIQTHDLLPRLPIFVT